MHLVVPFFSESMEKEDIAPVTGPFSSYSLLAESFDRREPPNIDLVGMLPMAFIELCEADIGRSKQ